MGDIGPVRRRIVVEPVEEPFTPSAPTPATPAPVAPEREEEPVPA